MIRAKELLSQLIAKHPDWNWDDLEGDAFKELMQAFRFAEEGDQQSVVLTFTVVKEFIRKLMEAKEQELQKFQPQRLSYVNKLYNTGFTSGVKEAQLRAKSRKTRIEKRYIDIADKLDLDLYTVTLIWSFVNGYNRSQEEIIQWAKKQYPQNKGAGTSDYYRWLSTFLTNLPTKEFNLFHDKPIILEDVKQQEPQKPSTVAMGASLERSLVGQIVEDAHEYSRKHKKKKKSS